MHLRCVVAVLALLLSAAAQAQCARSPRIAEVTLPGQFAVYYHQFRSNAAQDEAEFYGGVCVAAVGGAWTIIADSVRVGGLSTDIFLEAPAPILYLEGWRLSAAGLVADPQALVLTDATLVGPGVSGHADGMRVDLASGAFTLEGLVLAGTAFEVEGALATLQGEVLRVEEAAVTTCVGLERPPFAIESRTATVELERREVKLDGGTLRVGAVRIPLREDLTLSDRTLSEFQFPVKVAMVEAPSSAPAGPRAPGAGLSIRVVGIPLGEGVTLEVGGTGLDPDHSPLPVVLVRAASDEGGVRAGAVFGLEAGAPYLDLGVAREVTPWLNATLNIRSGAAPAQRARHEGRAGLEATVQLPEVGGRATFEAFAAATAVNPAAGAADPDVAGVRLGARASLTARTPNLNASGVPLGRLALESTVQATHYPVLWGATAPVAPATQWGVRLAPSWRLDSGPFSATLAYDARFTNAASPFDTTVDRLAPLQRATGSVSVAGALGSDLTGRLALSATVDPFAVPGTPAGVKRLRADGKLELAAEPWTVSLSSTFEAAGLVNPAPGVRSFVSADVSARRFGWPVLGSHVPYGAFELGVGAEYDLRGAELSRLEGRLGVPVAFESLEIRPFVAVDVADLLQGGAPGVSGYGLDVTFVTCCGSVTLGAVNDRGRWGASLAVDLERRPGGGGGASVPTEPAPLLRDDGFDPLEPPGAVPGEDEDEPVIMPGTP